MNIQALDKWHKTRFGYLVFALIELCLAYVFASLALSSGDWWEYVILFIFIIGFLQNFVRMLAVHKK